MFNSRTFQYTWPVFNFLRQILFSRTFQDGPSFSSTFFQAFANPSKRITALERIVKFNISTIKIKM